MRKKHKNAGGYIGEALNEQPHKPRDRTKERVRRAVAAERRRIEKIIRETCDQQWIGVCPTPDAIADAILSAIKEK